MRPIFFILLALSLVSCSNPSGDARRADILARRSEQLHRKAEFSYQRALRLMPEGKKKEQLRSKIGQFDYDNGAYREAVMVLKSATGVGDRRLLARALYKSGDITDALEVFNKTGIDGPADYLYDYGRTLEKSNLYDQALKVYGRLLSDKQLG